jgi:hypothetical protein
VQVIRSRASGPVSGVRATGVRAPGRPGIGGIRSVRYRGDRTSGVRAIPYRACRSVRYRSVGPVSGRPGNPESGATGQRVSEASHRELGRRPASGACPPVRYGSDWAIRHRGDRTAGIGGVGATGIRACISARDRGIRSVRYWGGRTSDLGGVRVIRCPNVQVSLVEGAFRPVWCRGNWAIRYRSDRTAGIGGVRATRYSGVQVSPGSGRPGQPGIGASRSVRDRGDWAIRMGRPDVSVTFPHRVRAGARDRERPASSVSGRQNIWYRASGEPDIVAYRSVRCRGVQVGSVSGRPGSPVSGRLRYPASGTFRRRDRDRRPGIGAYEHSRVGIDGVRGARGPPQSRAMVAVRWQWSRSSDKEGSDGAGPDR